MAIVIDAIQMCKEKKETQSNDVRKICGFIGKKPELVIINASENDGSSRYIKNKVRECDDVGIGTRVVNLGKECTTDDILKLIDSCKNDCTPLIVQLPIYEHLDLDTILNAITPEIDADGFTSKWIGDVSLGKGDNIAPATPKGVMELLKFHNVELKGRVALVIGRSNHVGKPLVNMLINKGATVFCANSKTENLDKLISMSDVVISCVGKQGLIKSKNIKHSSVIIGVGFTYIDGKQILDFDLEDIKNSNASLVSNRVNCTGKATVNMLIDNVIELYKLNHRIC